ncbi:hypothetical protein DITRI_Ditri09bG0132100 [Diplodiscus trichospermus]
MRRHSPGHYSPRSRRYGGRERSPPRRGHGGGDGGHGRRREQNHGTLMIRNIPFDCRPEELRIPFERFGHVSNVYIPKDYHTGEPRGFAFVQFVDSYDAVEAQRRMNGKIFAGREVSVVVTTDQMQEPEEMHCKARGSLGHGGRSSYYRRSRSRSLSRMRSPHHPSGSRGRYHSRSYSPTPRRQGNYSVSLGRRHADRPRSPKGPPQERDGDNNHRSHSSRYENANGNGYIEKSAYESEEARVARRPWPSGGRASRKSAYESEEERAARRPWPSCGRASRCPSRKSAYESEEARAARRLWPSGDRASRCPSRHADLSFLYDCCRVTACFKYSICRKSAYESEEEQAAWRPWPSCGRASRSPSRKSAYESEVARAAWSPWSSGGRASRKFANESEEARPAWRLWPSCGQASRSPSRYADMSFEEARAAWSPWSSGGRALRKSAYESEEALPAWRPWPSGG